MRGKVVLHFNIFQQPGITPAYAGKSFFFRTSLVQWQDHPRLCGEKSGDAWVYGNALGITPAYAGKSLAACG